MLEAVKSAAIKGIHWRSIQVMSGLMIHLASLAILARLLSPVEYGVYALGMVFFELLAILAQAGLGASIVWSQVTEGKLVQTLFGVSLTLSLLFGVAMASAGYVSASGPLSTVLYSLAVGLFFRGACTVPEGMLTRDLKFSTLAKIELAGDCVFAVVAVVCAWIGFGALSLAIATAAQQALKLVLIYPLVQPLPRFNNLRAATPLLTYGGWTTASRVLSGLGRTGDSWVLGHLVGTHALGLYNRAIRLGRFPGDIVQAVLGSVLFPSFSALRSSHANTQKALLMSICCVFFLTAPMSVATFLLAPALVAALLGDQWAPATPALQLLAALTVLNPLAKAGDDFLRSLGRLRFLNTVYGIYALLVIALGTTGALLSGAAGVALGVVVANVIRAGLLTSKAFSLADVAVSSMLRVLAPGLAAAGLVCGGLFFWRIAGDVLLLGNVAYLVAGIALSAVLLFLSGVFCPGPYASAMRDQGTRAIRATLIR